MKSFPFDSEVTYDEHDNPIYDRGTDSNTLAQFLGLMFRDGVFPNPSTGLQVTPSQNQMSVTVKPGNLMIQGRLGIEEDERTIVFEAAGANNDRIDAVVVRLNTNHDFRNVDIYVLKGTESATPVAPALTRSSGVYEMRLANVFITRGVTTIPADRITDTRLNTTDCGIVVANPASVDTTAIFDQYQAALDKYMEFVESCIDGAVAGEIRTTLDSLVQKIGASDISAIGDGTVTGAIVAQNTEMTALKKSVSDGKASVAAAITDQGVPTAADAEFATMAANIPVLCVNKVNEGITAADARANPSSANYQAGHNAGVAAADARANPSSANYQAGYAAGQNAVSIGTQSLVAQCTISGGGGEGAPNIGQATFNANFPRGIIGLVGYSVDGQGNKFGIHSISISGNTMMLGIGNTLSWWTGTLTVRATVNGY